MPNRFVILTFLFALIPCCSLFGQLTSANISGEVTDTSGASIPQATVTATDVATGRMLQGKTDGSGHYVLTGLAPDVYRLMITKSGFALYEQDDLTVTVGQSAALNVSLHPGTVSQRIIVAAESEAVDLRSPAISTVIDNKMARELPLNGRNVLQLMQLAPDAGPTSSVGYQQRASRPDQADAYVGTSRSRGDSTSYYLDGALNEDALTQIANVYPNPDAVQEFSFDTSVSSAKFANRGGGVMNAVTWGGTNHFHGTIFEFLRNSDLNGRNYFAKAQDGLKRNQFGGVIGGPIRKNKAFAFFSYQGTRIWQNAIYSTVSLTAAQKAGDFSANSKQLIDPFTGKSFPENQVPASLFDSVTSKLLPFLPNGDPQTGILHYQSPLIENDDQFVARVDDDINSNLRIYTSYIYDKHDEPPQFTPTDILATNENQTFLSQFAVVNATYIFQPTLTTTLVASFSRRANDSNAPHGAPGWTELGANIPTMLAPGFTSLCLGVTNYFVVSLGGVYAIPSTEGGIGNHWTWMKGFHTLEFGRDILQSKVLKKQDVYGEGDYVFGSKRSGDNALDFLLGAPSKFEEQANFYFAAARTLPALYFIDTWKTSRRLTLTLGVRWNSFVPVFDTVHKQERLFSSVAYLPLPSLRPE